MSASSPTRTLSTADARTPPSSSPISVITPELSARIDRITQALVRPPLHITVDVSKFDRPRIDLREKPVVIVHYEKGMDFFDRPVVLLRDGPDLEDRSALYGCNKLIAHFNRVGIPIQRPDYDKLHLSIEQIEAFIKRTHSMLQMLYILSSHADFTGIAHEAFERGEPCSIGMFYVIVVEKLSKRISSSGWEVRKEILAKMGEPPEEFFKQLPFKIRLV